MSLCWLLAGCDTVFHLDPVALPIDAPPDSAIDAAQCVTSPIFHDGLVLDVPCGDWGMPFGNGSNDPVTEQGGALTIARKDAGSSGCSSINPIAFDHHGLMVRIDQPESAANGYMDLLLRDQTATWKLQIGLQLGIVKLLLQDATGDTVYGSGVTYDPASMKFWRLRADEQSHEFVAELSGDAVQWTELARTGNHFATSVWFELDAGLQALSPVTQTAVFSHLNTCP